MESKAVRELFSEHRNVKEVNFIIVILVEEGL